jgi:hypothetical protein
LLPVTTLTAPAPVNLGALPGNQNNASIAIDPTNPNQVVAIAQDPAALYAYRSTDGGTTWTPPRRFAIQGDALTNDRAQAATCCPRAAFDAYGNLFVTYVANPADTLEIILSPDGGQSFVKVGDLDVGTAGPLDRPALATGPGLLSGSVREGSVWVAWRNSNGVIALRGARVTGLGGVRGFAPTQNLTGPNNTGNFTDVAVGPSGEVVVAYQRGGPTGGGQIYTAVDADGLGAGGFTTPAQATTTNVGLADDLPAAFPTNPVHNIDTEPRLAWDRSGGTSSGRAYLVYTDEAMDESNDTNIFVRTSTDGGTTWGNAVRVNDDAGTRSQFLPAAAVDQTTGNLAVSWYDARNDPANTSVQTFATVSTNGGQGFLANVVVGTGTTNAAAAVSPNGLGNSTSLAFHGGVFFPAWADNSTTTAGSTGKPTDVFAARVRVVTNLTFGSPRTVANSGGLGVTSVTVATFTDSEGTRPVGQYTATISWGDSKPGEPGTITLAGSTYTVTGSHTFLTAGKFTFFVVVREPGGQPGAAPLSTAAFNATIGTQAERFVGRSYLDILGRPASASEISSTAPQIQNGSLTRQQLANILDHSAEYRGYLVKGFYMRYLRARVASDAEIATWLTTLNGGGKAEDVQKGILSSPEYYQHHYSNGAMDNAKTLKAFYWDILGRMADAAGYNAFLPQMTNPSQIPPNVLWPMLTSTEYRQHLVQDYYRRFLRRQADPSGLTNYTNQLAGGAYDEDVLSQLVGSTEYYNNV